MSFNVRALERRARLWGATAKVLTGFTARLGAVVLLLVAAVATGLPDAADTRLRQHYYDLRGERASDGAVVLVGVDAETVAAWGAPPWSWERLGGLHAAIAAGKPRTVAVVEPSARMLPHQPPPATIVDAVAAGTLVLPPPPGLGGQPTLHVVAGAPVEAVELDAEGPTVTARVLERARLAAPGRPRLEVNFLGRALPVWSAHRVAAGDVPAATFAGKIVVVGLATPSLVERVPTPVGALAPAQVQAQALLSVADGATWRPLAPALRWLLVALFAALVLVVLPRLHAGVGLVAAAALAALLLAADYALFARGAVRLGASLPLLAIAIAAVVARVRERAATRARLAKVEARVRAEGAAPLRPGGAVDEDVFWRRASELARLYFDCRSSIVAELPEGGYHLRLRVVDGVSHEDIAERRRDVRREPFRRAHLTLGPVWHPVLMARRTGLGTLVVPLVEKARLHGFWLLNFPVDVAPSAPKLQLVQNLAHELALALARRERSGRAPAGHPGRLARWLGAGRLATEVDELADAVERAHEQHAEMTALGEQLPCGLAVATLWGELRYLNTTMKQLASELRDGGAGASLPDLVAGLTGMSAAGAHAALARLVREPQEVRLGGRGDAHELVLSRFEAELRPGADPGEALLVLCVLPRGEAGDGRDRGRAWARGLRSLGTSPPAFGEEDVTVLRAELPPPPTAPDPLPPAPQTGSHPRIEPMPAPLPRATSEPDSVTMPPMPPSSSVPRLARRPRSR